MSTADNERWRHSMDDVGNEGAGCKEHCARRMMGERLPLHLPCDVEELRRLGLLRTTPVIPSLSPDALGPSIDEEQP